MSAKTKILTKIFTWGRSVVVCALILLGAVPQSHAETAMVKCLKTWNKAGTSDFTQAQKLMAKGPENIQNLTPAEKDIIRNYITLTEMLKFRCSNFTPPPAKNPKRP